MFIVLFSNCAYYNTFYNAKQFYKQAEKAREEREKVSIVELSAEERAQLRKQGKTGRDVRNKPTTQEMQNYQKAIERSSRVLELYPDSRYVDDALMMLGKCFFYRQEYKKAQRKFDEIFNLYPKSELIPKARLLYAKSFIGLEEYQEAKDRLLLLAADQDMPKETRDAARYELGGLYYDQENYVQAAENYQRSIKSTENKLYRTLAYYRLGECYIQQKEYAKAPKLFRNAMKEAPNEDFQLQSMFKLGRTFVYLEDFEEAEQIFLELLSREYEEKRIPRIKLELAHIYREKGDLEEAVKWYNEIIDLHQRTDASARAYYALGEIEEFVNQDYDHAKEHYDMVRSEFSSSLIAPQAMERSDNIRTLLDLRDEIARLEGRKVEKDSTQDDGENGKQREDDGPIDLSPDGMWVNYSGRDRPPPESLTDLSEEEMERKRLAMEEQQKRLAAKTDSLSVDSLGQASAELDSAALAEQERKKLEEKKRELASKYLSLAEVLYFSFDKPDSAIKYYTRVVTDSVDTSLSVRALYSLAYLHRTTFQDTARSDKILKHLVQDYPETEHAEGARRLLGVQLHSEKVDSAKPLFEQGEQLVYDTGKIDSAFAVWDTLVAHYPQSSFAEKAVYAKAWHYENTLFNNERAKHLYQELLEKFPESTYAGKVKEKLTAVEQFIKKQKQDSIKAARADSLAEIDSATVHSADSLAVLSADSAAVAAGDSLAVIQQDSTPVQAGDSLTVQQQDSLEAVRRLLGGSPDSSGTAKPQKTVKPDTVGKQSEQEPDSKAVPHKIPPKVIEK